MAGRKKGKWSRRSQGQWRTLLAKFDGSGMGIEAFCRREAISAASFYRWRKRLGNGRDRGETGGNKQVPAFVDLGMLDSGPTPRPRIDLKLDLGDGLILHLVRS